MFHEKSTTWLRITLASCLISLAIVACGKRVFFPDSPGTPATRVAEVSATLPGRPVATPAITPSLTNTPLAEPTSTPLPEPTPPACTESAGRIEQGSLRSDRLSLPMEYRVWLPPCYSEQPLQRYPVLYLIHGQNFNDDQWDRLGADETATSLLQAGQIPPFLIVMPRDRNWGQPGEDLFGEVFVEELIPLIDTTYQTIPERQARGVGGLSRGAGWAVHLALSRPDLFGALGGHSLAVFWGDTSKIRKWLEAIPAESLPRIYLDIGDHDRPEILKSTLWFENLLTEKNIPHEWRLFTGYHEEAYWQKHLEGYLRWYAQGWAPPPPD